jgi:hypothetical protein
MVDVLLDISFSLSVWAGERDIKSAGEGPSQILLLVHLLLGERDSLMVFICHLCWWEYMLWGAAGRPASEPNPWPEQ